MISLLRIQTLPLKVLFYRCYYTSQQAEPTEIFSVRLPVLEKKIRRLNHDQEVEKK